MSALLSPLPARRPARLTLRRVASLMAALMPILVLVVSCNPSDEGAAPKVR